jgi:hypothetical protein
MNRSVLPYKCHFKDKSKFKSLQNNDNNMLAASWTFHQMMDGLNTVDDLPLVCISVLSQGNARSTDHEERVLMTLQLEFFRPAAAAAYIGNKSTSKRINETVWNVDVYVDDPKLFTDCVSWKEKDTRQRWQEHEQLVDAI